MPRLTSILPKYRKHSSGQARVTINGRDYLLGPHGTRASKLEYDRVITEYLASGRSNTFGAPQGTHTLAMVMADYLVYAKSYFGISPSSEWHRIKYALAPIKKLYASLPAADFASPHFKAVRQHLLDQDLCRNTINAHMKRIVRMMKWAASEGIVPANVFETLRLIPGLRKGRTTARETEAVKPVDASVVELTLKHLPPLVADMVRLQLLTGCRPGEVCKLTPRMIDRSGEVWVARPDDHKTAHHGHTRAIFFGPKAQSILAPYIQREPDDCLFRPADSVNQKRKADHAKRVTPLSCGNRPGKTNRRKTSGRTRVAGESYTVPAYARAITRAAEKAGVQHWAPNQLRHSRATEIRKMFGLEAAQVVLGHASADITQTYAERNESLASEVALKTG